MSLLDHPEAQAILADAVVTPDVVQGLADRLSELHKAGGSVKLVNLNRRNIELLVMTKLTTVFETFTDEQDAVNSFFPDRKLNTFDILSFVQQMKKEE